MANYEQFYQKSIEALTEYIEKNMDVPTEKEWNRMAIEKDYLTSQSMGYIANTKFPEICKKIYKELRKKRKED